MQARPGRWRPWNWRRPISGSLLGARSGGCYDVLVTRDSVVGIEHQSVQTLDVLFDERRRSELTNLQLAGCRFDTLTDAIERAAAAAGAVRLYDIATVIDRDDRWTVASNGQLIRATHVVIATGAPDSVSNTASAHAQVCRGFDHNGKATLYVPAVRPTHSDGLPTPVLITPSAELSTVTVFATGHESVDAALKVLREEAPPFAALRPVGPPYIGRTYLAFDPNTAVHAGTIVVGAAIGVTNPFVGTGISTAMVTGKLAATAIAAHAGDPAAAADSYVQMLSRDVIGHSGTAGQVARRYHLTWRVLSDTAGNANPFFAKARRAILVPDGIRMLGEPQRVLIRRPGVIAVAPFLFATTEIAVAAVRREWPFIAALIRLENDTRRQDLRPALLFAGAVIAAGAIPDNDWAGIAAAIELAMLGMLALTASGPTVSAVDRGVDWPSASAVLAGDFLLAQATRLVARHQPDLAGPFADWMAELVTIRTRRIAEPPDPAASVDFFACLFEFPARIAAQLADGDDSTVARLREFGGACGRVFLQVEDLLTLRGEQSRLDATRDSLRDTCLSGLPDHIDPFDVTAIMATTSACHTAHAQARRLLGPERPDHVLSRFLDALAEPATNAKSGDTG